MTDFVDYHENRDTSLATILFQGLTNVSSGGDRPTLRPNDNHIGILYSNKAFLWQSIETSNRAYFSELADRWISETSGFSSIRKKVNHKAYQDIIALGQPAIGLILNRLQEDEFPRHWFVALKVLTGEDPILPNQRGVLVEMKNAWLDWGRTNGYIH